MTQIFNELKEQLNLRGVSVSESTIARCLEGKLITMKKLEQITINRNCEELKESRKEHAAWLMSQHELGARFCYVDECGFGLIHQEQEVELYEGHSKSFEPNIDTGCF